MRMLIEFSRSAAVRRSTSSDTDTTSGSSMREAITPRRACTVTSSPIRSTNWSSLAVGTRILEAPSTRSVDPASKGRRRLLRRHAGDRRQDCGGDRFQIDRRVGGFDRQLALAFGEDEDIAHCFNGSSGPQRHLPLDVAALRIQFADGRNRSRAGYRGQLTKLRQLPQQQQWLGSVPQEIGSRNQANLPLGLACAAGRGGPPG